MSTQKLEDMSYDELVEYVALQAHSALLTEGGRGLRNSIHLWLHQAIIWSADQKEKEKKAKKR